MKQMLYRKRIIQRHIQTLLFYVLFSVVFFYFNSESDADVFFMVDGLERSFDNSHVRTVEDFWTYLKEDVVSNYYKKSARQVSPSFLLGTTKKVGGWRIGTLRMKQTPCFESTEFADVFNFWSSQLIAALDMAASLTLTRAWKILHRTGALNGRDEWHGHGGREDKFVGVKHVPLSLETYSSPAFSVVFPQESKANALQIVNL